MRAKRCTSAIALTCILGLIGAACGDDDDEGGAPATAAEAVATTAQAAAATTAASAETAATTSASPAGAAGDRSAFGTAKLVDGGPYGQDPGNPALYTGAGGFELDLANCPGDYDPMQGITDTEIRLGTSVPRSGALAGFGLIADGMTNYFNYLNDTFGGIDGRRIVLDVKDDGYEPARTKINIDEMVQSGDYAAFSTIIGTPNNLGIWDDLNEECMPQLMAGTGGAQWGDVENHPWTTGMQLDYFTEASLWATWLKETYPDGVTVATITYNNDFGVSYAKGFRNSVEGSNIEIVKEELHEAATPNLTNQFTSLAASNAEVLLVQTSGTFCTQSMAEVEKGSWKPLVIMSATCASLSQFFKPLIDQGLTGADTHIVQWYKDVNESTYANEPFVQFYKETAAAGGLDPAQSTYATGWIFAWYTAEVLNLAAQLEGGLSRPNLVIANRSIEAQMPLLLEGLQGRMEGLADAYLTEGGRIAKYTVTDPAQLGTFEPISETLNLEGQLGTYATVAAAG